LLEAWPVGKIPVLHDAAAGRTIPETSIIIEYLQEHYPGRIRLLPEDAEQRLEARLWDRFFDLYVSVPMQKIVTDRIRPVGQLDPHGVAEARAMLQIAYPMIDRQLSQHDFAIGSNFSMADCSAVPALFFARIVEPFGPSQQHLNAYFERLMARPSVIRTIEAAKPYFSMFPYQEAMEARFRA
jgi:glutathione S-transferase